MSGAELNLVTYLDTPTCLLMVSHCEQFSPMAMLRGGYVYSTVWKVIWASTKSRLVQNTALIKRPVWPGRQREKRDWGWILNLQEHGSVYSQRQYSECIPVHINVFCFCQFGFDSQILWPHPSHDDMLWVSYVLSWYKVNCSFWCRSHGLDQLFKSVRLKTYVIFQEGDHLWVRP